MSDEKELKENKRLNKYATLINEFYDDVLKNDGSGEVIENIKLLLHSLGNKTYNNLIMLDQEYQSNLSKINDLEEKYAQLDISPQDREIIDELLSTMNFVQFDQIAAGYAAGFNDSYSFLKYFGITNE